VAIYHLDIEDTFLNSFYLVLQEQLYIGVNKLWLDGRTTRKNIVGIGVDTDIFWPASDAKCLFPKLQVIHVLFFQSKEEKSIQKHWH